MTCSPAAGCLYPTTTRTAEMNGNTVEIDHNKCLKPDRSRCCVNYYFDIEHNRCDPCPLGSLGINCTETCPPGYYGLFCEQKCDCDNGIPCSPTTGCGNLTSMADEEMHQNETDIDKSCWKPEESRCCVNYYFNNENNSCDPCPLGTLGINCNGTCPPGYYGFLCKQECKCDTGISCSPTTGCANLNPVTTCPSGTFGENCSSPCPTGYYGVRCQQKCNCDIGMTCSPLTGCVNLTTTVEINTNELDIENSSCWNPQESTCCTNYFFNMGNKSCDACPLGTFGENCSLDCPHGYYGHLCEQECNCSSGMYCSNTKGCVYFATYYTTDVEMNTKEMDLSNESCWKPEESKCCENYYFNSGNKSCDQCSPGTFGDNCSASCPPGCYGQLCKQKCNCSIGMHCSPKTGCVDFITVTTVEMNTNEVTMNKVSGCKRNNSLCCVNYYYDGENSRCKPCPNGTFGISCSSSCPQGHYGHLCKQKCDCRSGIHCSPQTGCTNLIATIDGTGTLRTFLHVVVTIFILCLAVSVFGCCRFWKFDMKRASQFLRFKVPGNSHSHTYKASVPIIDANYALIRQPTGHTLQETTVKSDDQMETAIGKYNEISLDDSVFLKRQTSEYNILQLRIHNISCNSFEFDTMEKDYEKCHLSNRSNNIISEASHDVFDICYDKSGPAREMAVSDHWKGKSGFENTTLEVQVHTENENTRYSKAMVLQDSNCSLALP